MYDAGARGLLDQESNDFQQLVNDQPQTLQSFYKKIFNTKGALQ